MVIESSDQKLGALILAAASPSWEQRAAAGRGLAMFVGRSEADSVLARLLLDRDTGVTYETGRGILAHGGAHGWRMVIRALGAGEADTADELAGVIMEALADSQVAWDEAWARCEALASDPDEAVGRGATSVLSWRPRQAGETAG